MSIYLYGLQRSGTNVINTFLVNNFNIKFNNDDNNRNSIIHKHFRIYNNKNNIPETDKPKQYYNNIIINTLEELDEKINKKKNKYIIVYKNIYSWLPSIEKWGKMCNWKSNNKLNFINDYCEYISKWKEISNKRVLFIKYEDYLDCLVNKNNILIKRTEDFLQIKRPNKIIFPQNVNCSSTFTLKKYNYYKNKEYMKEYTKEELNIINNKYNL